MNRKKIYALALIPILFAATASAQGAWTLDRCVNYALKNNIQVKQAELSASSSEVDVKEGKAALFPSLTFNTSQQLGFQKVASQDVATNIKEAKNPTYTGSYSLNANVVLFDGGSNWRTLRKNKLAYQGSLYAAQMTANSIEIQIINAYYQILYAHESVLTDSAVVETAAQELERTQELLKVGKAAKVDVAQMESQYQQNVYQWVNAKNTEAANVLTLKQLLQLDTNDDFAIDFASFATDDVMALIPPVEEAQTLALGHLPDLKAAQTDTETAKLQEKIARGGYYPTLSLNGSLSTSNGNTYSGDFSSQIDDHLYGSVGLSLSVPLYDRRSTRSTVDRAKINVANSIYAQEDTRLSVCNTIASLHLDILSAQSRYESAVKSEASAQESFELMSQRYAIGLESLVDLLTEKNTLLSAQQETLQSKYTALLNLRLMNFYTGQ